MFYLPQASGKWVNAKTVEIFACLFFSTLVLFPVWIEQYIFNIFNAILDRQNLYM